MFKQKYQNPSSEISPGHPWAVGIDLAATPVDINKKKEIFLIWFLSWRWNRYVWKKGGGCSPEIGELSQIGITLEYNKIPKIRAYTPRWFRTAGEQFKANLLATSNHSLPTEKASKSWWATAFNVSYSYWAQRRQENRRDHQSGGDLRCTGAVQARITFSLSHFVSACAHGASSPQNRDTSEVLNYSPAFST